MRTNSICMSLLHLNSALRLSKRRNDWFQVQIMDFTIFDPINFLSLPHLPVVDGIVWSLGK